MVNWVSAPMRTPLCPRKFKHFRYCNYIDMLHQLAFVIVRLWKHTNVCLCACVHNKEVAEIWPFNYWKKNEKSWFWNSCIFCRELSIKMVAAGAEHTAAITEDGSLWMGMWVLWKPRLRGQKWSFDSSESFNCWCMSNIWYWLIFYWCMSNIWSWFIF